jgi:hypothetical protein
MNLIKLNYLLQGIILLLTWNAVMSSLGYYTEKYPKYYPSF